MLAATGLTKRYGGSLALDGAALALHAGEVHAVVGENGAGKSTLVKILSGVVRPDGGRVELAGAPTSVAQRKAAASGIALVSQELAVFGDLSVAENLFPHGLPRGRRGPASRAAAEARARPVLDELGLRVRLGARAGDLALADRQLLEISRALVTGPRVLILDEPTSALPAAAVERLAGVLLRLSRRGIAILYISHILEEVLQFAQRVTVLRDGRVALGGAAIGSVTLTTLVAAMLGEALPEAAALRAPGSGDPDDYGYEGGGAAAGAAPIGAAPIGKRPVVLESVTVPGRLDAVSLTVDAREIVGLAGLQGSGHLAVLDVLSGRARPESGVVRLVGQGAPRSVRQAIARGVAVVPSDRKRDGLMLERPVWENNASVRWLGLQQGGRLLRRRELIDRAVRNADRLRIKGDVCGRAGDLSGGNQQKVVFAKWLEADPLVLLLDDPTRGVDIRARAEMHAIIRGLAGQGKAVLVASTDLAELVELCDRVLVFRRGRIADELGTRGLTAHALSVAMNAGVAG